VKSMHYVVNGKVQGVFFRSWVFDQARSLGVKGWVRNVTDGKVEVLGQGEEDALKSLKERLMQGSSLAQVQSVESNWTEYEKTYDDFEIRG